MDNILQLRKEKKIITRTH